MSDERVPEFTLGDRLAKARKTAGLSQDDMAEDLECARQSITRWENGHTRPRLPVLKMWSLRTGVALEWLRYGDRSSSAWIFTDLAAA